MGRDGVIIDCRTEHDSYFPDPDNCNFFYHCSDWAGLEHKSCGTLYFHPQKKVCDWPYIVRKVRFDCPSEDSIPHSHGDIIVTDIEQVVVDDGHYQDRQPQFDDGSYIQFEPEPQNRFRFPGTKPKKHNNKVTKVVKKHKDKKNTFEENVDELKRGAIPIVRRKPQATRRPKVVPDSRPTQTVVVKKVPNRGKPFRLPKQGSRKTSTTTEATESVHKVPSVFVRHRPNTGTIQRFQSTTHDPFGSPQRHQIHRVPVIRTPPPKGHVKSHPGSSTSSKKHRTSLHKARDPFKPSRVTIQNAQAPRLVEEEEDRFHRKHPQITLKSPPRFSSKDLFKQVQERKEELKQKKIQLLLEAAKVKEEEESKEHYSTETVEEATTPKSTTEKLETKKSVAKPSQIPFKTPEERPEFLGVIKKKAEDFKEKILALQQKEKEEDEEEEDAATTKSPKYQLLLPKLEFLSTPVTQKSTKKSTVATTPATTQTRVSKTVTTRISAPATRPTITTAQTSLTKEIVSSTEPIKETTTDATEQTTINESTTEIVEDKNSPTSTTGTSSTVEVTTEPEKDDVSTEGADAKESSTLSAIDETGETVMIIEPVDPNEPVIVPVEDEEVYVVDAVPMEPKAQPFVAMAAGDDEIELNREIREQERGLQLTIKAIRPTDQEQNHQSSYDMVMNVMHHFNIEALMDYLSGKNITQITTTHVSTSIPEPVVKKSEQLLRAPKRIDAVTTSTPKSTLATTIPDTTVPTTTTTTTKSTTKTTTTTPTTTSSSTTRKTTKAVEKLSARTLEPTYTTSKPATVIPSAKTSTEVSKSERVHIVLPEGYSIKPKKVPNPQKYMTIVRSNPQLVVTPTVRTSTISRSPPKISTTSKPITTTPEPTQVTEKITIAPTKATIKATTTSSPEEKSHPFGASLDYIRQRLQLQRENKVSKKPSTHSVLQAINAKTLAEAELRRNPPKFVSEAKKKESKQQPKNNKAPKRPATKTVTNEEEKALLDAEDASKLAERRKALFLSRARQSSTNPLKPDSVPLKTEAVQNRLSLSQKDLFSSESRFQRPILRRPKSPPKPTKVESPSPQQERSRSIRCIILRQAC